MVRIDEWSVTVEGPATLTDGEASAVRRVVEAALRRVCHTVEEDLRRLLGTTEIGVELSQ